VRSAPRCTNHAIADPSVRPADAAKFRRQFEAICAVGPPPFGTAEAPALTRDPEDDPIVYGALLAGSGFLVSDDGDIVPDRVSREYEHAEYRLRAVTFREFVHDCFEPQDFPWSQVEGAWLREAFRRPRASAS
jgi:hypothetical protein